MTNSDGAASATGKSPAAGGASAAAGVGSDVLEGCDGVGSSGSFTVAMG
ncbi:hypothetical protein [Chloracidobacterium aggregatum]|nr:hypothetical protein [Chloracidobacterium aggregatum]